MNVPRGAEGKTPALVELVQDAAQGKGKPPIIRVELDSKTLVEKKKTQA